MADLIDRDELKNHLYKAQAEAFKEGDFYCAATIQLFINIIEKEPIVDHIADDSKKVRSVGNG